MRKKYLFVFYILVLEIRSVNIEVIIKEKVRLSDSILDNVCSISKSNTILYFILLNPFVSLLGHIS